MIVKKRGTPMELYRLEALDRRLHPQHRMKEKVLADLIKKRAGIRGEREVDYPLKFLSEQDHLILHNLRLPDQNGFFQIDTLILSEMYILILEVKNWYGTIIFGENGQVTRVGDDGIEEGFPNPIPQAKLQQHRLQNWLHSYGISNFPVDFYVVISFPSTIIKSESSKFPIPVRVIHNSQLFFEIQKMDRNYQVSIVKMNQLMELAQQLKKAHTSSLGNIMDKYGIATEELIRGVFCPNCSAVPMIRDRRKWLCNKCNYSLIDAHLFALNDYQLLIGKRITNRGARDFLEIASPDVAKKLLQREGFSAIGKTSSRYYQLKWINLMQN